MAEQEIRIDADKITIDDLVLLEDIGEGKASLRDIRDLLNRVVVGGVGKRRAGELRDLAEAVNKAVSELANPKEAEQA